MIFLEVILPLFSIFALGFTGQKFLKLDIKSLSKAALYLMTPVLVFRTFYSTQLNLEYLYILLYSFSLCFILIVIVKVISHFRKYSHSEESGLTLATAFMNNGNFGVPLILLVFGQIGFNYAISIMVIQTFLMSTLGLYIAAKGNLPRRKAFFAALKMPVLYTAILGIAWQFFDFPMSDNMYGVIDLLANAAIPTIMLTLGVQLAEIQIRQLNFEKVSLSLILRLLLSPAIAFLLVFFLPISIVLKQVMIVLAAMPSAANTTMYSLQYNSEPNLVSSITLLSTVLCAFTLPILLEIIR